MPKLTKACLHPWKTASILANGQISPCCGNIADKNFGDINIDLNLSDVENSPVFKNRHYPELKESLLKGEPYPDCINCRIVAEKDISTDELKRRIVEHLGKGEQDTDLINDYKITDLLIGINNKCNLRCIYCAHSSRTGNRDPSSIAFYNAYITEERFLGLLDFLVGQGLKILSLVGLSEFTVYKNWKGLSEAIFNRYPALQVQVITNLSKKMSDDDIRALLKFHIVTISCDTLDKELHEKIRFGSNFEIFRDNLSRLLDARRQLCPDRNICFNVVESDLIVKKLDGLFRFAAKNDVNINFSNLFYVENSVADKTKALKKVSEMTIAEILEIWPMIQSLPRRLKAESQKADVWQIGPFFNHIKNIAKKASCDLFHPDASDPDDIIYIQFNNSHTSTDERYLRDFYLSFDERIKGIYVRRGERLRIPLNGSHPFAYDITTVGVIERTDKNLQISVLKTHSEATNDAIEMDASRPEYSHFSHVLFSITPTKPNKNALPASVRYGKEIFIRETLPLHEIDDLISDLAEKRQAYVIWCAGARTRTLFEQTSLGKLNILAIVDSNPVLQGSTLKKYRVESPETVRSLAVPVLIINATNPYAIEQGIKSQNYSFTDYLLL